VHNALSTLPCNTTSKISSVVLFGDPKNGTALPNIDNNKVDMICHATDNICAGGDLIRLSQLNYSADAGVAANFVVNWRGLGMLGISSARVKTGARVGIA
jgi:cutinase